MLALVLALGLMSTETVSPTPPPPDPAPVQVLHPEAAAPEAPKLDDVGKRLDAGEPPGLYEMGVRQARSAAEARSGDLEGGWTLKTEAGEAVMRLQFSDQGEARPVEAAFHDLRTGERGVADGVERRDGRLVVHLTLKGGSADIVLERKADGGFSGAMTGAGAALRVALEPG